MSETSKHQNELSSDLNSGLDVGLADSKVSAHGSVAPRQSRSPRRLAYDPSPDLPQLRAIIEAALTHPPQTDEAWRRILRRHPKAGGGFFSKAALIAGARHLVTLGELDPHRCHQALNGVLRMKPSRTQSGVSTLTLLTKPYPCPGQCIFCPNDVSMPKSYLADEPGAQRAAHNEFDPFSQTWNRLLALLNIGHPVEKIEVIVLGGTWSAYTRAYQRYFIHQIFEACNLFGETLEAHLTLGGPLPQPYQPIQHPISRASATGELSDTPTLEEARQSYNRVINSALRAQQEGLLNLPSESATWGEIKRAHEANVNARCRVVGLTIETRPDEISPEEVERLRRLGATKVQLGVQSLNDHVLKVNHRGHSVEQARRAVSTLRSAGFKLHLHWMANLYGSDPAEDLADYQRLFNDPSICPDELKLYPCSLIPKTPLMSLYQRGEWRPYERDELLKLLTQAMPLTPEYCRLTRVIRDIPSTDIHVGNQETNFREVVEETLKQRGVALREIRSREVRGAPTSSHPPQLRMTTYETSVSVEHFVNLEDAESGHLLGFCRLSLPKGDHSSPQELYLTEEMSAELKECALLREVHVYGQSLMIKEVSAPAAQHRGFGKRLVYEAADIARHAGFKHLAVISAIGTRAYYEKLGFHLKRLYQHLDLCE